MAPTDTYLEQLQALRAGYWKTSSNRKVPRAKREVAEVLGLAVDLAVQGYFHTSPEHIARGIGRLRRALKQATGCGASA